MVAGNRSLSRGGRRPDLEPLPLGGLLLCQHIFCGEQTVVSEEKHALAPTSIRTQIVVGMQLAPLAALDSWAENRSIADR